jgi:AcrR family transcriptional regulator
VPLDVAVPEVTRPEDSRRLVGRPRDAALDHQILASVRQLLVERGYQGLSVQEVTRRSGAHAATIARRWESKAALVAAAVLKEDHPFTEGAARTVPTGHLREDLLRLVTNIHRFLADPVTRAALPVLWGEVHHDAGVQARVERRRAQWVALVGDVLRAAVDSGDAPPGVETRVELLTDVLAGTAFARQGQRQGVPDDATLDQLTDFVLAGLLAAEGVPA